MGDFPGHVIPGSYLTCLSIWWIVNLLITYHKSKQNGTQFRSAPSFKCGCLCGRLKNYEVDGALKLVLGIGLVIGEMSGAFQDGKFVRYGMGQHATIFAIAGLSGAVDVLRHHKFPVPEAASYVAYILLLVVEYVLFKHHLHGRDEIDVLIHTLVLNVILVNVAAFIAEMRYRNSIVVAITRCYLILLQGTWFITVAFILYNPFPASKWDPKNHDHYMLATMLFTWHILGLAIFVLILNCIISKICQKQNKGSLKVPYTNLSNSEETAGLLHVEMNGNNHTIDMLNDLDDLERHSAIVSSSQ